MEADKVAGPDGSALSEGLGLAPEHSTAWMPTAEALRLAKTWTDGLPLDDLPQWRTAIKVLADEIERLRAALAELVACKDLKARVKADDLCTYSIADAEAAQDREDEYLRREPLAWTAARAALGPNAEVTVLGRNRSNDD